MALADGESLELSLPVSAHVDAFYVITAEGMADGAHRLFAYATPGALSVRPPPMRRGKMFTDAIAIFGPEGVALESGPFVRADHGFAPPEDDDYSVCGYLDAAPEDVADAVAEGRFAVPSVPWGKVNMWSGKTAKNSDASPRKGNGNWKNSAPPPKNVKNAKRAKRPRSGSSARCRRPLPNSFLRRFGPLWPRLRCVHRMVPALRGHSLAWTRRALVRAHCSLGRVQRAAAAHGSLVVIRQDMRRGTSLRDGASVGVALGHPPR